MTLPRRTPRALWVLALVAAVGAGLGGLAALREPAPADATAVDTRALAPAGTGTVAPPDDITRATSEPGVQPEPAATPEPAPPATRDELTRLIGTRVVGSTVATSIGVSVVDEAGRAVAGHRDAIALLPASTMKLLTAAAALETFGPDHRFDTTVSTASAPTPGGTVVGDLRLVGGGDPVLATDAYRRFIYPARPRTSLEELAEAVVAAGVERVLGGVVGVSGWPDEPLARGWSEHYLSDMDARRITGLTVDAGLDWRVVTTEPELDLDLHPSTDPVATAARDLARLLVERGVTIEGGAGAAGDEVTSSAAVATDHEIARVSSPPLSDLLRHTVERSDNPLADTLFRALGAAAGDASWSGAGRAVTASLDRLGVSTTGLALADGSGLSRLDRIPTATLAELDRAMAAGPHAAIWTDLMAVAGTEGTLRRRLVGTVAEGRLHGKTGTLDDVVALAGSVHGPGERRYHFAVVANLPAGASRWDARVVADEVVLLLAQDLWCGGPVLVPAPPPSDVGDADDAATTAPAPVCPS